MQGTPSSKDGKRPHGRGETDTDGATAGWEYKQDPCGGHLLFAKHYGASCM